MYDDKCAGCARSQSKQVSAGGILPLSGDWIANQYAGSEGWLGWLALQPRYHRMAISQLSDSEASALGKNIQILDGLLTQYWKHQFPKDPIERVYIVYFFESAFETPAVAETFHLHIHLIPRFESLNVSGALHREEDGKSWADGWWVPCLRQRGTIPEPYAHTTPKEWESRATALMDYLRQAVGPLQ